MATEHENDLRLLVVLEANTSEADLPHRLERAYFATADR